MKIVFLGIGTNLGDRERNLEQAVTETEKSLGRVMQSSSLYETEPWGFKSEEKFLNMVVKIRTNLSPPALMENILILESMLGRERGEKQYISRLIDIDILFYDDLILIEDHLKIPHPLLNERKFVLIPLCEIEPAMIHPVLGKTIDELLGICEDTSEVRKFLR
jgi:2-amino-4-hydroxy-6-hydroxymethyldihydropteridine diphosphokinase